MSQFLRRLANLKDFSTQYDKANENYVQLLLAKRYNIQLFETEEFEES